MSHEPLPPDQRAGLVALVSLPELGPARLRSLLGHFGDPRTAWEAVRRGRLDGVDLRRFARRDELVARWRAVAADNPAPRVLAAHRDAGVAVLAPGDPEWPAALVGDPEPPDVLFARGDPAALDRLSVAVVGTRRCTAAGAAVARTMGAELAVAGVGVVSGLAVGIDGAAHRGVLEAGGCPVGVPVGVVATGLDVVYPGRHRALWSDVADTGVLVSEAALGVTAERWRFPARNRLIAAFAAAVVVVESPLRGGSIFTAESAEERHTPVLAVPGSVLTEQSAGTNQLIFDGCGMARDAADVLGELGTAAPVGDGTLFGRGGAAAAIDDPVQAGVAEALSPTPTTIEAVAATVGRSVLEVTTALAHLEAAGVARRAGAGYRRAVP